MAGTGQAEQQGREQEAQRAHQQREANTKCTAEADSQQRQQEADRHQRQQEAEAKQKARSKLCSAVGDLRVELATVAQKRAHCFPQAADWAWTISPNQPAYAPASSNAGSHRASPQVGSHLQAAETERRRQREQEVKRVQQELERKQREAEEASLHCLCCLHGPLFRAAVSCRHSRQRVACRMCGLRRIACRLRLLLQWVL